MPMLLSLSGLKRLIGGVAILLVLTFFTGFCTGYKAGRPSNKPSDPYYSGITEEE